MRALPPFLRFASEGGSNGLVAAPHDSRGRVLFHHREKRRRGSRRSASAGCRQRARPRCQASEAGQRPHSSIVPTDSTTTPGKGFEFQRVARRGCRKDERGFWPEKERSVSGFWLLDAATLITGGCAQAPTLQLAALICLLLPRCRDGGGCIPLCKRLARAGSAGTALRRQQP
ncbi:hypothetical protein GY45DRAFT_1015945 [Cubamyces sp. BRFM 1775]|nr:hypothetical protein GY45DRAFT_1015945 [Cubamyces sp. BRFM 1775]